MTRLQDLDTKLATINLFEKMTEEKREELADAIYMSALRSNHPLGDAIAVLKSKDVLPNAFFDATAGNIFSKIDKKYKYLAQRLFLKRAGGGTPNAAMGKAELLLLLLNTKTKKPVDGDIEFDNRRIEIKTNGGKLGIGSGKVANAAAVTYCGKKKIGLKLGEVGKAARNQPVFNPMAIPESEELRKEFANVLHAWWQALADEELPKNIKTWKALRKRFLKKIINNHFATTQSELLVFDSAGNFQFFKDADSFVQYYDRDEARFEYRAYQANPFSLYLDIF